MKNNLARDGKEVIALDTDYHLAPAVLFGLITSDLRLLPEGADSAATRRPAAVDAP